MDQRQPNFLATWPKLKNASYASYASYDNQDWSPLTIRSRLPKPVQTINSPTSLAPKKYSTDFSSQKKFTDSDTAGKLKQLTNESRHQIALLRLSNKWSQADLNQRCAFPNNTIRELESGKLTPTIGQLNALNRVLKTSLKFN